MKHDINDKIKDIHRIFLQALDNEAGVKALEYLDKYSHNNFPNYDNVNATYSKIGEQNLVNHIKGIIAKAKQKGE